jgi:hypothetical protein
MRRVMQARRPQLADAGVFLLVVALPLVFTPFSASPFGDPKLVVLVAGTLALWTSGLPIDRRLGLAALVWVAATAVAALAGVDPSVGLTARTEGQGGGLIVVACAGALCVLGAGLGDELRERARRWLVAAGTVVATIGLAIRVWPDLAASLPADIELIGATLGNQIFAAAFMAAAVAAAIGRREPLTPGAVALIAFLTLGTATFGERSSIVLPVVAAAAALWRSRTGMRSALIVGAAVIAPLIVWQALEATLFPDASGRGAAVAGVGGEETDVQRATVWRTMARATAERPALGWGPGSARSASLAVARSDEVERAGRQWADAHDLFLETAVTSGIVGLVGLVWLAGLVLVRSLRAGPDRAWAFGAAAGLAAYSLVEPVGLVLTPLLFLFAGAATGPATGPATERAGEEEAPRLGGRFAGRGLSIGVTGLLAIALVVAIQMQAAASFERWGRVYGEAWALRTALRVQPWRLSSAERLALNLALDGRAGDEDAAAEARRVIAEAVEEHPWDPDVRLWAADVETLLRDDAAAEAWVAEHLERFPGDVPGASGSEATGFENPAPGA